MSAAGLTHGLAVLMTLALFALLLCAPFPAAFFPAVLLLHRIGVMVHEYIHGIPFRQYRHSLRVLAFVDGVTLSFGLLEFFRVTHLMHHRWLNSRGDATYDNAHAPPIGTRAAVLPAVITRHVTSYLLALRGRHLHVRCAQSQLGLAGTVLWMGLWLAIGRSDIIWKLLLLVAFTSAVPVSLRRVIEHYSESGASGFANEYRVLIPLFNINRHIHHHEQPRVPWYALQFRTAVPLPWHVYFSYWFRAHIRKELVLMRPMPSSRVRARSPNQDLGDNSSLKSSRSVESSS